LAPPNAPIISQTDEQDRTTVMALDPELSARLKRNDDGLFAAVAQERGTGIVLMMAWMDDVALERTLATRQGTYYSRSRQQYWVKGETSGHTQYVHDVRLDCDGDTVLLVVDQVGAACHTGNHSCFDTPSLLPAADGGGE
jgi:phosphoribosyl-AMP cyclohydrolase